MEYSILELSKLAGISTRTLRYYDQIGLLTPVRDSQSRYRIYREQEVDVLQQILFYKELGFSLSSIQKIIKNPEFDHLKALNHHLQQLEKKEQNLRLLIQTVKKTIQKEEGMIKMTDAEKFAGLKETLLAENERIYGNEIRQKYGADTIEKSNEKFKNLTEEEYHAMQSLTEKIQAKLEEAVTSRLNPLDDPGKEIASLHKEWLSYTWNTYSADAHKGLAEMYVADERFREYYDKNVSGCAEFLKTAIQYHII